MQLQGRSNQKRIEDIGKPGALIKFFKLTFP
jgi:hypothetical protein